MPVQIVEKNAEEALIEDLKVLHGKTVNRNILLCRFSTAGIRPKPEGFFKLFREILPDRHITLYFCRDGDIFVLWVGQAAQVIKVVQESLFERLSENLEEQDPESFFQYYDSHVHIEDLKICCHEKIFLKKKKLFTRQQEDHFKGEHRQSDNPCFSPEQLESFSAIRLNRLKRIAPEILVVEDQAFSRKLLECALGKNHTCHVASNAMEALAFYALYAPDIVFLDIELPDGSGHALAEQFQDVDPDAYIIMVTANNYEKDVLVAKKNKVKGYIIKPFTLEKIYGCLESYIIHKQGKTRHG